LHFIKQKVDNYFSELDKTGIDDSHIRRVISGKNIVQRTALSFLYFILAFPFFGVGVVTNYIPYYFTGVLARKITPHLEYRVAIAMLGGMLLFLLNYVLLGWLCNVMFHMVWLNWALVVALPLLGLFAYRYKLFFVKTVKRWKVFSFFYRNNAFISKLLAMRNDIIAEFEVLRTEYASARGIADIPKS
jgi:hypothetical protein